MQGQTPGSTSGFVFPRGGLDDQRTGNEEAHDQHRVLLPSFVARKLRKN